jgi:hypothetical protein
MMNTKTNEIYGSDPVVNANDMRVHVLNIDSRYRDSVLEPATNFHWTLPAPIKNVIKARITSLELPNKWLAFTKDRGNIGFTITAPDGGGVQQTEHMSIPDGNCDVSGILATIQGALDDWGAASGIFFSVEYDASVERVSWIFLGTGAGTPTTPPSGPFALDFNIIGNPINKSNGVLGLGFYLGFAKPAYPVSPIDVLGRYSIIGECAVNLLVDPYVMLAFDNMNCIVSKTAENYFEAFAKIPVKVPKGGHVYLDFQDLVGYEFTAPAPMDLKIMLVQLLDRNGDLIESCQDFSFTLEVLEVTNLKLHDHFRNYNWLGVDPRIGPGARGSAVAGYLPLPGASSRLFY